MSAPRWNPPPGWPVPPPGWAPPPGWQPDPSWPAPPADWQWTTRGPCPAAAWSNTDGSRRIYTRTKRRWILIALTLFVGLDAAACVQELRLPGAGTTVCVSVVAAGTTVAVIGIYRMAILVQPDRVTVRRMLWTHRVPAADVERFAPPRGHGVFRQTGLRVYLRDGRVLSATAFTMGQTDSDTVGVAEAAELNDWLTTQGVTVAQYTVRHASGAVEPGEAAGRHAAGWPRRKGRLRHGRSSDGETR